MVVVIVTTSCIWVHNRRQQRKEGFSCHTTWWTEAALKSVEPIAVVWCVHLPAVLFLLPIGYLMMIGVIHLLHELGRSSSNRAQVSPKCPGFSIFWQIGSLSVCYWTGFNPRHVLVGTVLIDSKLGWTCRHRSFTKLIPMISISLVDN